MYASIGTEVPTGRDWTFELKYDGIRVLAHCRPGTRGSVRLMTRNLKDKSTQFPEVVAALRDLVASVRRPFILDGEIVALVRNKPARFQELQQRMHVKDAAEIERHVKTTPVALIAFDVLLDGSDSLLAAPWTERRERLELLLADGESRVLRIAPDRRDGRALLKKANADGWEGIIAKRRDGTYRPGRRADDWLKLKVEFRQEFVVGGYTEPKNSREFFGALLLGYFDNAGEFIYVGSMGSGFDREGLEDMHRRLRRIGRATSPFTTIPRPRTPVHWVKPSIVVEVKFGEWTADRRLRQPIFLGIRDDKPALAVGLERVSVQRRRA